jgi:hypothetical protein
MKRLLHLITVIAIYIIISFYIFSCVGCKKNNIPDIPMAPDGPASGVVNVTYEFTATTTDLENEDVAYQFSWGGDDTTAWSNFVHSGEIIVVQKSFTSVGIYPVRVRAKDIHNNITYWSDAHHIAIDDSYWPLNVGNIWKYTGMTTITTTTVDTVNKILLKNEITANNQTISGNTVFTVTARESIIFFNPDTFYVYTDTSYVRQVNNAILTYTSLTDPEPDTSLMINLAEGKTWTQLSNNGADTVVYTVLVKEYVAVPAGIYNAWKVKAVWNSGTPVYYWYAGGVGMVRYYYEYTYMTATVKSWMELTAATIH